MNEEKAKELHQLLFSFMGTFHKKILIGFRKDADLQPRLKKNQSKILNVLYQKHSITPTELGKCLDIEKGGLTTIIDQLVEMELVIRTADPFDRRKTLLSLGVEGKRYMENVMQAFSQLTMELFRDVEPKELDQYLVNMRYVTKFMKRL